MNFQFLVHSASGIASMFVLCQGDICLVCLFLPSLYLYMCGCISHLMIRVRFDHRCVCMLSLLATGALNGCGFLRLNSHSTPRGGKP